MPKNEPFGHITCEKITVKNNGGDSITLSVDNSAPKISLAPVNGTRVYLTVSNNGRIIYGVEGAKKEFRLPNTMACYTSETHGITIDLSVLYSIQRLDNNCVVFKFRTNEGLALEPISVMCKKTEDAKSLHYEATEAFSEYKSVFPMEFQSSSG